MILCHVSWDPLAFTWKSGWRFWTSECCCVLEDTSECCCVLDDLRLGSSSMNVYEFMGLSYACQMNFKALSMSSVICTNIRMLLDNAFSDLPCNACRREESGFCIFMSMLWGIVWSMYSINSHTCLTLIEWDKISFLLLLFDFHLLYCSQFKACVELNILIIRMFLLFHLGWPVRLPFDVIKS